KYTQDLVNQTFKVKHSLLIQPFYSNSQIKNRLIMLKRKKNRKRQRYLSYVVLVPILAGSMLLMSSFSVKQKLGKSFGNIHYSMRKATNNSPLDLKEQKVARKSTLKQEGDTTRATFPGGRQAMMQFISKNLE